MKKITIQGTDVYLDNCGKGKGKITISDSYRGAFTYFWGSMGDSLEEFICRIDPDYFAGKLCKNTDRFSIKGTLKNLRRAIKEELSWFEEMPGQKELRWQISHSLEGCVNEYEFISACQAIPDSLYVTDYTYQEQKYFIDRIRDIFKTEPWHYIDTEPSSEYKWLKSFHSKLKNQLNKP